MRVFISSVQKEFAAERKALAEYLSGNLVGTRFGSLRTAKVTARVGFGRLGRAGQTTRPLTADDSERDTQDSPHMRESSGFCISSLNPVEFDGVERCSPPSHRRRIGHKVHGIVENVDHARVNSGDFAIVASQAGYKHFIQSECHLRPSAPSAVTPQEGCSA